MDQLHSSETFTMTDLLTQVGEWSTRNFGTRQASDLGILEELGEATHGILKRFQNIRGFDNVETFRAHVGDAFADMGIYILNYAGINGILLTQPTTYYIQPNATDRFFICNIMMNLVQLISFSSYLVETDSEVLSEPDKATLSRHLQALWQWCGMWAYFHQFDFMDIVSSTWLRIRTRDWQKNNKDAHLTDGGYQPAQVPNDGSMVPLPAEPQLLASHADPAGQLPPGSLDEA